MPSTRLSRKLLPVVVAGLVALVAAAPNAAPVEPRSQATPRTSTQAADRSHPPRIPQLPRDFRGRGRYIVRDLGFTVPFTWEGRNGNSQMVAGGPDQPIWFENIIYDGTLYTITYIWPNVDEVKCVPFKGFDRHWLNRTLLPTSRYVGREILNEPRRYVDHWRAGLVFLQDLQPEPGPPVIVRLPAMVADIYVDQKDSTTWWKVLQFGVQNQLDPALDEWIVMDTFEHAKGRVRLPAECAGVQPSSKPGADIFREFVNADAVPGPIA